MDKNSWTLVIRPQNKWFNLNLKEVWDAKDLLKMFVWRDFISLYKQTVLGPLWLVIQPILNTSVYSLVFGSIAHISTEGLPRPLFYLSGIIGWNYFSDCLLRTGNTFSANSGIFGKVYFPRLIVPLSVIISNLFKFFVQFLLFLIILSFFIFKGGNAHPNNFILLTPLLLIIMAGLGLGFGLIISSLTTKYRDLQNLVAFGVQLLMYGSSVVIPLSAVGEKYRWLIIANPITHVIETFKFAYMGTGSFNWFCLSYSFLFMIFLVFAGIIVFNRTDKSFIDTV